MFFVLIQDWNWTLHTFYMSHCIRTGCAGESPLSFLSGTGHIFWFSALSFFLNGDLTPKKWTEIIFLMSTARGWRWWACCAGGFTWQDGGNLVADRQSRTIGIGVAEDANVGVGLQAYNQPQIWQIHPGGNLATFISCLHKDSIKHSVSNIHRFIPYTTSRWSCRPDESYWFGL